MLRKQFTHFRYYDRMTGELSEKGGVSVCYLPNESGTYYKLGFSFCSVKDNFNRKRGCFISEGRAKETVGGDGLLTYNELISFAQKRIELKMNVLCDRHKLTFDFYRINAIRHPFRAKKEE